MAKRLPASPSARLVPGVKTQPHVQRGFQRGFEQLVQAIRPTLGPRPRHVVSQTMFQGQMPELLDNGAVIARRIVALPNRVEDVGAMYLREMLWKVHETAGDGTATAAVLFQSIYCQGLAYVAAGGNAMLLRQRLVEAVPALLAELDQLNRPLSAPERVRAYAHSLCGDADLARVLAEAFDLLGADGRLEIRKGRNRKLVLELFDGLYWPGGLFNRELAGGAPGRVNLLEPAILLTDLEIKTPAELVPLLDLAHRTGIRQLVLMAASISDNALALLRLPANRKRLLVVAVKPPAVNAARADSLNDLALVVGGRPLVAAAGETLASVRPEHFGHARRAWADTESFGLEAGQGDPRALRAHLAWLRGALRRAEDPTATKGWQQRLSGLINGSAVLWVGADTPLAVTARLATAQRTVEAVRGALREGVLPGGGVSLLSLRAGLLARARSTPDDVERAAYRILGAAVEGPLRALLHNAGYDAAQKLAEMIGQPAGYGCDVLDGEIKDLTQAGIVDAAPVVKTALYQAIQSAALALTIDVVIQRARPPMGIQRQ